MAMKFTLITPAQEVASIDAGYINVPGEAGDFGVLPGHMPLIATLRDGGEVRVTDTNGEVHRYIVTGAGGAAGFADVRTDGVTILAETANNPAGMH